MAVLLLLLPAVPPHLLPGSVRPQGGSKRGLHQEVPAGSQELPHQVKRPIINL